MNEKLSDFTDLELLSEIIRLKPMVDSNMITRTVVMVLEKELDRRNDERGS